jgi:hypothetical protein
MGLPLLEAMEPGRLAAATASSAPASSGPVRMAFVFFPNGAIMPSWKPEGTDRSYRLSETLAELEEFRGDLNVITGLAQDNGRAKGDGAGDHARCASTYLTGAHPVKTAGADIQVGVSVDQVAAQEIGPQTKLPSLEIGIEAGRNAGNCDSGYSCAYSSNISWKTPSTPMAKEINPRLVFERLFGNGANDAARAERDFYRKSILDYVAQDARKLKERLGQTDRRKIDEYFQSVRELESRIARAEQSSRARLPEGVASPPGIPDDLQDHIRLMYDLMALAFRTDSTRVATYMLANAGSNRAYSMVGVNAGHHELSHHRNQEDKVDQLKKIDKFLVSQFAYFLRELKSIREGERTLLDNCMILYGSGLSDGNRHQHDDLPAVLAGRGGGTIDTGRHLRFDSETPMNNLFLSMLDRVGARVESIGDSSGRLTQLTT